MESKRVLLAISVGLVIVLGTLVVVLSQSKQRLAGSNTRVHVSGNDVPVRAGTRNCQPDEVPADAAEMRVFTGVPSGTAGPLDVIVKRGELRISRASFREVADGQPATTQLRPPIEEELGHGEVCLINRGDATIRLAGDRTPVRFSGSNPYGVIQADEPRVDYLRSGSESWWGTAGLVGDRFGLSKTSFFGSWTMWAVFALVGATWLAALLLLVRRRPAT